MNTQSLITQEIINRMKEYNMDRRRNKDCIYNRTIHNNIVQSIINELSIENE
jgi:hypothetical protein